MRMEDLDDPIEIVMWSLWTLWLEGLFTESENPPEGDEPADKPLYVFSRDLNIEHQCMDIACEAFGRKATFDKFPQWVRDEACMWIGRVVEKLGLSTPVIERLILNANDHDSKAVVDFWWYSVWQGSGHGVGFTDNWEAPGDNWRPPYADDLSWAWHAHVSELVPAEILEDYRRER